MMADSSFDIVSAEIAVGIPKEKAKDLGLKYCAVEISDTSDENIPKSKRSKYD